MKKITLMLFLAFALPLYGQEITKSAGSSGGGGLHSSTHSENQSDEVLVESLGSSEVVDADIPFVSDGSGGVKGADGTLNTGGSGVGKVDMLQGTPPGAPATADMQRLFVDDANSRLYHIENGGSAFLMARVLTHATDCTSVTGDLEAGDRCHELDDDTNYTYDGTAWDLEAGGGGATSIHYKDWSFFRNDSTQGTTSKISNLVNVQSTIQTGDWRRAMPSLDGTTQEWMNVEWYIPADWTGNLDFYWGWGYDVSSTANDKIRFLFDFGCIGSADDMTATPPSIINKDVTKTVANIGFRDFNSASHLAVDISSVCNPEELMVLRFGRVPGHADDNRTDDLTLTNGLTMRFETTP